MLVELAPIGRKSGIMAWEMALQGIISLGGAWIVGVPWLRLNVMPLWKSMLLTSFKIHLHCGLVSAN